LPALVAALAQRWSFTVGEALAGGTAAYVARVRTHADGGAVLKVLVPDPVFDQQIRTLVEARGRGYARVLAHDAAVRAVLIEELGPALDSVDLPTERKINLLAGTLREAWRVPPWPELALPSPGRDKATLLAGLVTELWEQLGHPCPQPVVDRALAYAARRAAAVDPSRCVVVHGDPHPANALRAGDDRGFVFVDPDGFLAEPEYDLGVVLRGWCAELLAADDPVALARRYRDLLVDHTGADPVAVWEWSYLERVSSGLYLCYIGAADLGRSYLATAATLLLDAA
jgi:streptomycin 6-kinase